MGFTWTNIPDEGTKVVAAFLTEAQDRIKDLESYSGTTAYTWSTLPTAGTVADDTHLTQFKSALDTYETNRNAKSCKPYCSSICTSHLSSHFTTYNNGKYQCTGHNSSYLSAHDSVFCESHLATVYSTHYSGDLATDKTVYDVGRNSQVYTAHHYYCGVHYLNNLSGYHSGVMNVCGCVAL